MKRDEKPKIICVGFQKTGTTSMNAAFSQLGLRVCSVYGRHMKLPRLRANYVRRGLDLLRSYDAVEDMPWPLIFREIDAAYPGARFILTWRETDRWLKSICTHFGDNPDPIQQLTYGEDHPAPVGHEAHYCEVYEAHNAAVREWFRDRPGDLLEMNLAHGDGWEKLCPFIGMPIPEEPFPRANTVADRAKLGYWAKRKVGRVIERFKY